MKAVRNVAFALLVSIAAAATYHQPVLAAFCWEHDGMKTVVYEGPNEGTFPDKESCEEYWNGQTPSDACEVICGSTCENGQVVDQCCPDGDDWVWGAGHVDCICTDTLLESGGGGSSSLGGGC